MNPKQTRKSYPKAFKEEAVALMTEQGYSATKAAEAVGITTSLLYKWKAVLDEEKSGTVLAEDERTELKRLHKEHRELKLEKAILKKASAFFAKEMLLCDEKAIFLWGACSCHRA